MCFHEFYYYKIDLEVTITLCHFIPMFHLKKNIQFIYIYIYLHIVLNIIILTVSCTYTCTCIHIVTKKNLIFFNATLSVVNYIKNIVCFYYFCLVWACHNWGYCGTTAYSMFHFLPVHRHVSWRMLYIDMFHGECCTQTCFMENVAHLC